MTPHTTIIIPCFNEGEILRSTIQSLLPLGYEIVVVDDGSAPSMQPLLQGLPVHYLRHVTNLGQGAALQTGMEYSIGLGAENVIHFDADGQHSPQEIPRFIEALKECDAVLGSRFLSKENAIPSFKRFLLQMARLINFCFTGVWLSDAHNGFRALGPRALRCIHLTENRMAHATEIVAQLKREHLRIKELPCTVRYTGYSRQKGQKWYNSFNILIDLILNKLM